MTQVSSGLAQMTEPGKRWPPGSDLRQMNFLGTTHPARPKDAARHEREALPGGPSLCGNVPTRRRSSLAASQLIQLPALALVRTVIRLWTGEGGKTSLLAVAGGTLGAGFGFRVAGLRFGGRTAPRRQGQYVHIDRAFGNGHTHALTDAHDVCGLHPFAVELDLAAADGVRCQGARLEQAHMPQPFVDAVAVVGIGCHDLRMFGPHRAKVNGVHYSAAQSYGCCRP